MEFGEYSVSISLGLPHKIVSLIFDKLFNLSFKDKSKAHKIII